jgi:hypothetical protein
MTRLHSMSTTTTTTYYYADSKNQTVGPVSLADLREKVRRGEIPPNTPVIAHGSSTWTSLASIPEEGATVEIAEAVVQQARILQGHVSASFSEVSWGAAGYGLLLVFIQLLVEPLVIFRKCLVDLSTWGKASRLPSSTLEFPVPTFLIVVMRAPVIVVSTILSVVLIIYFLCTGQLTPFTANTPTPFFDTTPVAMSFGARLEVSFWRLVATYFEIIVIAFLFDLMVLALNTAQNVKKIADKQ